MRNKTFQLSVSRPSNFKRCVTNIVIISQVSSHCAEAMDEILKREVVTTSAYMMPHPPQDDDYEMEGYTQTPTYNFFQTLNISPKDLVIFPSPSDGGPIINYIESENQSFIGGSLECDEPSSMIFKNSKGFIITNPLVRNLFNLEFISQSDEYIESNSHQVGAIAIKESFFSGNDDLESLAFKASTIHVSQSILDPSRSIIFELLNDDMQSHLNNLVRKQQGFRIDQNSIIKSSKISVLSQSKLPILIEGLLQSTKGNIEFFASGDVILHKVFCNGNLIIHTPGLVKFEEDVFATGNIEVQSSNVQNNSNISCKDNIDFKDSRVVNNGVIKSEREIITSKLSNTQKGHITAQKIHNLISILSNNEGTIEHLDNCVIKGDQSVEIRGTLTTNGLLDCQLAGDNSTLTLKEGGKIEAAKGATLRLHTLNNHGKWGIAGDNLSLYLTHLNNYGDMEAVNGIYGEVFKVNNQCIIRTLGHSTFNCTTLENKETGRFYTAGVHHVTVTGSYLDSGYVYSPTLFLLQGAFLHFLPHHQSFITNGVIKATQKLNISPEATLNMRHRLQLSSDNLLTHQGTNNQLKDNNESHEAALYSTYYTLSSNFMAPYWERNVFKAYVNMFLRGEWGDYLRILHKETYGIVTKAQGDLVRSGSDNIQAGSSLYTTFGQFKSTGTYIKTGFFPDNNLQVQANSGCFTNTAMIASTGNVVVRVDKEMEGKKFQLQAKAIAELNVGAAMSLRDASVEGRLVALRAQKDIDMTKVALYGRELITVNTPATLNAKGLTLRGKVPTLIEGTAGVHVKGLHNENRTTFKSTGNTTFDEVVKGGEVSVDSDGTFTNNASVNVNKFSQQSHHFQNNKKIIAKSSLTTKSETYADTGESLLEGTDVQLDAPSTKGGFKGKLKASVAEIALKDMKLQEVLQHADVERMLTYRVDDKVVVDDDLIVNCKLVLHAVELENKAKIVADKEFIAFVQGNILNSGKFSSQRSAYFQAGGSFTNTQELTVKEGLGVKAAQIVSRGSEEAPAVMDAQNIYLESTQESIESQYSKFKAKQAFQARSALDTRFIASAVEAGQSIHTQSARDTLIQSAVKKIKTDKENFKDYAVCSLFNSGGSIALYAGNNTTLVGTKLKAEQDIGILSQNFYSLALGLEEHETRSITDGSQTTSKATHDVSQIHAKKNIHIHTTGMNYHQATDIAATNLSIFGQDVVIDDVNDRCYVSETSKHEGGLFGQDREYQSQRQESTSRGANFKVFEKIGIKALNHISLKNIKCHAQETILDAPEVKILLGRNQMQSASTEKSSNILWVSNTQSSEEKLDHQASQFKGQLRINAKNAVVERVARQTLDFMTTMNGEIENLSEIDLVNYYNKKSKTVEGPSQALAMVIALATSLTGVGSALGAAIVGTTLSTTLVGTMVSAAMTTLCSQAAVQLVAAKGDIVQAAEAMANTKVLESVALSALTAGITSELCNVLNVEIDPAKKNLFDNLQQKGVENSVNFGAVLVQGGDVDTYLKNAAVSTVVGAMTASAAYEIGKGYSNHQFDAVTHKFLHAALGAGSGALQSDDPVKGALAGALGATIAVTVSDVVQKDSKTVARNALEKAEKERIEKTPENMRALIRQEVQQIGSIGKISSAVTALFMKQDMNISMGAAANAVENNCVETITAFALYDALVMTGFVASAAVGGAVLYETVKEKKSENENTKPVSSETGGNPNDEDPCKGKKARKRDEGPRFIGKDFKGHADRHQDTANPWKHENNYYNDALKNIKEGMRFKVRHDARDGSGGQNKFVYITRNIDGTYKFTSTTLDGKGIFTHYPNTTLNTLINAGITLPKGF